MITYEEQDKLFKNYFKDYIEYEFFEKPGKHGVIKWNFTFKGLWYSKTYDRNEFIDPEKITVYEDDINKILSFIREGKFEFKDSLEKLEQKKTKEKVRKI